MPNKAVWYFTFGSNHIGEIDGNLGRSYMKAEGDFHEARQTIVDQAGLCFAFQYSEDEKANAIDRYDLKEVQIQAVHRAV